MTEPLQEITLDQSYPFSSASTLAGVAGADWAYPVSIDGRGFMVDIQTVVGFYHSMQRSSVNLLNTQQAASSGDLAQVPPEVWRRSVESWTGGSGQARYDREGTNPNRFSDSHNIDVWTPWRLSLLNETSMVQALAAGTSHLSTVGTTYLFAGVNKTGYWWTDLASPPSTTTTFTNNIADVCSDGKNLYVLDSTGVVLRYTNSTTSTTFATLAHYVSGRTILRYVGGFLFACEGNSVYDISSGVEVLVYTHPLTDFTYVDGCEGLQCAYLVGGMGDRWGVYRMPLKADGTTFERPVLAGPIPEGEIAYSLASYLGYVLIGVNSGWRFAAPASDGTLTFGSLIETGAPVLCFEGQDRFVWYGRTAGTMGETVVSASGLGRADLSSFVASLTPAYAPDLSTEEIGSVRGVTTFGATSVSKGARVFTIDGVGVFVEQPTLAPSGWIDTGTMTFGTSDPKLGLYAQVYHEPLAGALLVEASYDDAAPVTLGVNDAASSVSMGNMQIERSFNSIGLRVTLTRDEVTDTSGPRINRIEVRALPVPGRATEWTIPLMLSDTDNLDTSTQSRSVTEDYDMLIGLVETRRAFVYREGDRTWTLHATDFTWMPRGLAGDRSTFQGTFVLTAREVR